MNERYISPAEQEHLDHVAGSASEFENCFSEARSVASRHNSEGQSKIAALVAAGRFVVVCGYPHHCKATDAFAGTIAQRRSDHASRAEADAVLGALFESGEFDPDCNYYVAPRLPAPPALAPRYSEPVADDDVPF
jgi:hypothetical protein